jgi:hypothetical protein
MTKEENVSYTASSNTTKEVTLESIGKVMKEIADSQATSLAKLLLTGLQIRPDDSLTGYQQVMHVSPKLYEEIRKQVPAVAMVEATRFMGMDFYPMHDRFMFNPPDGEK